MGERKFVAIDPDDLRFAADMLGEAAVSDRLRAAADAAFTVEDVLAEWRVGMSWGESLARRLEPPVEHQVMMHQEEK